MTSRGTPPGGLTGPMMSTELSPVDSTPLTSVADENIGIENGVIKGNGVLTELDRVSPTFYKRETMPTAYGIVDHNGNTQNGTEVDFLVIYFLVSCLYSLCH